MQLKWLCPLRLGFPTSYKYPVNYVIADQIGDTFMKILVTDTSQTEGEIAERNYASKLKE